MPRIFDNIGQSLLPALQETLRVAEHADFCAGYFHLRGWSHLADPVDTLSEGNSCRLLIGMQVSLSDELLRAIHSPDGEAALDNQTALREKCRSAEEFRQLAAQIRVTNWRSRSFCATPCAPNSPCSTGSTPTTRRLRLMIHP